MHDIEMETLLTLREAAKLWHFDPSYLRRILDLKRIRHRRSEGVILLSRRDCIRAFGEVGIKRLRRGQF